MKSWISILLLPIYLNFSCKQEERKEDLPKLRIIFNLRLKMSDNLQFYYRNNNEQFNESNSETTFLEGSELFQKVKYEIPMESPYFRFDFGKKENQLLEINYIRFKYKEKVFEVSQNAIFKLFNKNGWVEFEEDQPGKFKPLKNKNRIDPKLIVRQNKIESIIRYLNK